LALSRRDFARLSVLALAGFSTRAHAAGLSLDALRTAGAVRIGLSGTYPPFNFRGQTDALVGYDVDVAALIWMPIGVKPEFITTNWGGVITALYNKAFDLVMGGMAYSPERMRWVTFSIPYADASPVLLIPAELTGAIRGPRDLDGRVVGIEINSFGERQSEEIAAQNHITYRDVRKFDSHPAALAALEQAKIEALFSYMPVAAVDRVGAAGKFALVRGVGGENWAGMAARKEDSELIQHVDRRLTELKADGQLVALQEKWFGFRMTLPDKGPS